MSETFPAVFSNLTACVCVCVCAYACVHVCMPACELVHTVNPSS